MSDLAREAERAADRLRIVGPRLAARGTADADAVLDDVRVTLQALEDLAAGAEGREPHVVPRLGAHALGDQVLVLAGDVARTGDRTALECATALVTGLRAALP